MADYRRIDTHVHCRDEEQAYKTTISQVFELADKQGIWIICDEPNTSRPVTTRERVRERLVLVPEHCKGRYFTWVGLTADPEQIEEAIWCYNNIPEVVGFKHFPGPSVGDLNNTDPDKQRLVWNTLADLGYEGPVANHCEDDSLIRKRPDGKQDWDPSDPITHCRARPEICERESAAKQCLYAMEYGFKGLVHIVHVSAPGTLNVVQDARRHGLRTSSEVTPHHAMWDDTKMYEIDGLRFKMNPPLRNSWTAQKLQECIKNDKIDCIGTDHALHTDKEKFNYPYLSGYPAMTVYSLFVDTFLPEIGLTPEQIKAMTSDNARRLFEKLQ